MDLMPEISATTAVHCDSLEVRYGDLVAVDGVSFDVQAGEIFGLLGPNAAGKTSVVRALTTIIEPSSGASTVAGVPLTSPVHLRQHIGVLPESNGYPGAESAFDYLRYFGRLFGMTVHDAEERANDLSDLFGLGDSAGQRISAFSRGMRQRLGICRALMNRPAVLFLDEPTLGLDPAGREDILNHLRTTVLAEGTTVVLCSHLLDDVERICDRVAILHRARLAACGTVAEVATAAGIAVSARVFVERGSVPAALRALQKARSVTRVVPDDGRPGQIALDLTTECENADEIARALLAAGISILGLQLKGIRLSDAFMALTGETEVQR